MTHWQESESLKKYIDMLSELRGDRKMNEIMIKEFDGNEVEIIEIDGELYFEIYSTGMALGQVKEAKGNVYPRKERIDENIKNAEITPVVHNGQLYINEQQLYDLMLEMKTDRVKPFRKWLTGEVLPSIRKHGTYMTDEVLANTLDDPDFIISLATKLKEERIAKQKLAQQIEEQAPKVKLANAITGSETSILIGDMAKILKQNGVDTGERKLFKWLRENKYLISRKGESHNLPTQLSLELGIMEYKESIYHDLKGEPQISKTPVVTGKGQKYFVNKFLKDKTQPNGFKQINLAVSIS